MIGRSLVCVVALVLGAPLIAGAAAADPAAPAPIGAKSPDGRGHKVILPTQQEWHDKARVDHRTGRAAGVGNLQFGGGVDGIGVTTGTPQVYVVFWGSQWGSSSTGADGYLHLSGDTSGMAPRVQAMLQGLGTSSEKWSGVMTQYCEGVAFGATSCPASSAHVGYPTGGALKGVWADGAAAAPSQATGHDIGVEAVNAAAHFGNTSPASNRNAQYVIVSPTGTHPDGFNTPSGNFCAWHDYNGDSTLSGGGVSSPYGDIAFTNLPYVTDLGASCGANYVNAGSAGALDGVTIVAGHEYAETITDQNPAGGWTDSIGYENGDKCAWVGVGGTGGAQNVTFATGSFAMQATWANDSSSCQISHAIVGGQATNDFAMSASPPSLTIVQGSSGSTTINTSVTSGSAQSVTLSLGGVPAGVSGAFTPNPVTAGGSSNLALTVGASATPGTYTLVVTGTGASATRTANVSLAVQSKAGAAAIVNGGFETGNLSGWTAKGTAAVGGNAHSGSYAAVLGSVAPTNGDSSLTQTFTAPASGGTLSVWYRVYCPDTVRYDWATVTLRDVTAGTTKTMLGRTCSNTGVWNQVKAALTAGHKYTLTLLNHDDNYPGDGTRTQYDDVIVM
jgi:serine protease